MRLQINGSESHFDESLSLSELLTHYRLKPETVVVEYNFQVPGKDQYSKITLQDGDRVEIVKFMGGG